jgi:cell wall-associated NlpC family hydrolase
MDLSPYVGLPFKPRGRDRSGVDCWGLLRLVYEEQFGIKLPSYADDYTTLEDKAATADLIDGNKGLWREISAGAELPGDGLLMSVAGRPIHIGVVIAGGRVLHIERDMGAIIESYRGFRLRKRIVGFYRHTLG